MAKRNDTVGVRGSGYFSKALNDIGGIVRKARAELKKRPAFDVVCCTGVSGMVFGPVLAYSMRKRLIVIRKTKRGSHASSIIEGNYGYGDRVLLVDDFTSTGNTMKRMRTELRKKDMDLKIVGAYLYTRSPCFTTRYNGKLSV
jgi:orotate phosphoribosyltransferase